MKKHKSESMYVVDHLKELRNRLIVILITFIVTMLVSFQFSGNIVEILLEQGYSLGYSFIYLNPSELFMQYLKVAIVLAISISIPMIFYQTWSFIKPAFDKKDNVKVLIVMLLGLMFFLLGATFSFFVVSPFLLQFFYEVNASVDLITAQISISNFISFYLTNLLSFGVIFELPVVTAILSSIGLCKPSVMIQMRKVVIVGIFVCGAIITPPEVVSQIMVAIPMILLYELSILVSKVIMKLKAKKSNVVINQA